MGHKHPPLQLPTVRDISFSTSVALISIIEPNTSFRRLTFKFLQLLDFVFIELRRGYSPWAFSYSLISCANADKKRLNVESLASLPEACSHAALALLTLCLSCSIARRTASSSEQSMIGFRPLPERVFNPSIPSDLKRFTQAFTLTGSFPFAHPLLQKTVRLLSVTQHDNACGSSAFRLSEILFRVRGVPPLSTPILLAFPLYIKRKKTINILCKLILLTYLS